MAQQQQEAFQRVRRLLTDVDAKLHQNLPPTEKQNSIVRFFIDAKPLLQNVVFPSDLNACHNAIKAWRRLRDDTHTVLQEASDQLGILDHLTPTIVALDDIRNLLQKLNEVILDGMNRYHILIVAPWNVQRTA